MYIHTHALLFHPNNISIVFCFQGIYSSILSKVIKYNVALFYNITKSSKQKHEGSTESSPREKERGN